MLKRNYNPRADLNWIIYLKLHAQENRHVGNAFIHFALVVVVRDIYSTLLDCIDIYCTKWRSSSIPKKCASPDCTVRCVWNMQVRIFYGLEFLLEVMIEILMSHNKLWVFVNVRVLSIRGLANNVPFTNFDSWSLKFEPDSR